jgi:4-hydroxybenzoate polyprenyltransferase
MQLMILYTLLLIGRGMHFHAGYRDGLIAGACLFLWQQWLIRRRERDACLAAFLNNNYFGFAIFAGIVLDYTSR